MNRWILEMREYNYDIHYLKGKDNFVADQLSRPVRVIVRPLKASWPGLDIPQYMLKQREDTVWKELIEYLKGGNVPCKRLPNATLDQFVSADELLYYVRENNWWQPAL